MSDFLVPLLRVNDLAAIVGDARKIGTVAGFVAIIAGGEQQEPGAVGLAGAAAVGLDAPARVFRGPVGADDLAAEADAPVDAVFPRRLLDIGANLRPPGDGIGQPPRLEAIPERVHVRIGANAGIAEQIPGAAHAVAAFEHDIAHAGASLGEVAARADSGKPRADDRDIERFVRHDCRPPPPSCAGVMVLASALGRVEAAGA